MAKSDSSPAAPTKFGTFGGVFTPSTLTILGVIMFLRFGLVVGESGLIQAVIIVLAAKLITTLTALSVSGLATNTRVKGGGAYYLISRSLGVEFGGAIGVVFFLAQAISVALYVIGFTEAFQNLFPQLGLSARAIGTIVNIVIFICVYIGASWAIKVQYGILGILLLALVSFFAGAIPAATEATLRANLHSAYPPGESVFVMFALFFPAVTGIMAGVNMSGDLQNPAKSIPRGTLAAIGFTAVIYIAMAFLFAAAAPRSSMLEKPLVILDVAWSPMLINAGIFAATLSSALGSMMGAPRILQALARDEIFPRLRPLARGSGASNEPRRATVLTLIIAQVAIVFGDLNAIAPIITMFFMVTYGTINLACFYESATRNPSYRPSFKLSHWSTALLGAIGCVLAMVLLDPVWAAVGIGSMVFLKWWIGRKEIRAAWGDVRSGTAFEQARRALLKLEETRYHPKNWRPIILALSGGAWRRNHLAQYGSWLTAGRGIMILAQVMEETGEKLNERRDEDEDKLRKFIAGEDLQAFPAVVIEPDLIKGVESLVECCGIGGIRPNTVLLGWAENPKRLERFCQVLRRIAELERSALIVYCPDDESRLAAAPRGTIDVWWQGGKNGALMLLLAHMLAQNPEWRNHSIRLVFAVADREQGAKAREQLTRLTEAARVPAEVEIVAGDYPIAAMRNCSQDAALVLKGFTPPNEAEDLATLEAMRAEIGELRRVIMVYSAGGHSLSA
ncbi:MAG: amino acid permease [Spartobacteria bacterium]